MAWYVARDEVGVRTSKVLVAADYELLDDDEAVKLAGAILDVASRQIYYASEGGARYETRSEYEDRDRSLPSDHA
jgi:hypothetical protein